MLERDDFISRFGGVFEHSPFIAERAYDAGLVVEPLTARCSRGVVRAVSCRLL